MDQEIKIRRVDFYPTDWLEGTIGLTHVERSVYITICAAIYAHGGPVEVRHVRRLCPGPGFAKALRSLESQSKVRTSEGLCYQERAELEVSKARDRIETARINGAKGGRHSKELAKAPGFFLANPARKANNRRQLKNKIQDIKEGDPEEGRFAPLGAIATSCERGKSPALKAKIRDQLMMKHFRYLQARAGEDEINAYWCAMAGDAETGQRMFDAIDDRMRCEGWDDVREREEREMAA